MLFINILLFVIVFGYVFLSSGSVKFDDGSKIVMRRSLWLVFNSLFVRKREFGRRSVFGHNGGGFGYRGGVARIVYNLPNGKVVNMRISHKIKTPNTKGIKSFSVNNIEFSGPQYGSDIFDIIHRASIFTFNSKEEWLKHRANLDSLILIAGDGLVYRDLYYLR